MDSLHVGTNSTEYNKVESQDRNRHNRLIVLCKRLQMIQIIVRKNF